MSLDNLKQFYKSHKESVHQQVTEDGHADHGDEAIQERTKHILDVMSRKDSYKDNLQSYRNTHCYECGGESNKSICSFDTNSSFRSHMSTFLNASST